MTKVRLQKSTCLRQSGELLVCEIDDQMNPLEGAAQSVWAAAGDELRTFRDALTLPLQEGSLKIFEPETKLKGLKYTSIANIVVPTISDPNSLSPEDRGKLKNCYDTIFSAAAELQKNTVVIPFLGKVRSSAQSELSAVDAVDIAFRAAFEAIQNGLMEAVEEIMFTTTLMNVYDAAKSHVLYQNRKEYTNRQKNNHTRECSIGESTYLREVIAKCDGGRISLLSVIEKCKTDSRTVDLLGCSHEADLIMSRVGKFDVNWESDESRNYDICDRHLNIMLLDWRNPFWKIIRLRDGNTLCSFPDHRGPIPVVRNEKARMVTKADSMRWMKKRNTILAVGAPLCDQDLAFLRGPEFDPVLSQPDFDIHDTVNILAEEFGRIPSLPKKTKSTADREVKDAVKVVLQKLNRGESVDRRKDWKDLSDRQKREKVLITRTALEAVCEVVAPDAKEELREKVFNRGKIESSDSCAPLKKLLTEMGDLYQRADSKMHRLFILSSVATLELHVLQQFFPGLTPYYHKKARTLRVKGTVQVAKPIRLTRWNEQKVDKLLEFVLGPMVVLNLPFDERQEKMDSGGTMSMPNLMRLQTIDEVYRMYLSYLEEEKISEMALKATIAKFIIKLVAPTRRKNLTFVDEKLAEGMKAFDDLFAVVDELLKKGFIEKDTSIGLIKLLQSGKAYLRGDFKVHVNPQSFCADHCSTFALSDPRSPSFADDCSTGPNAHVHDSICQRCQEVDSTFQQIRELLENAENTAETEAEREHFHILNEESEINYDAIYAMKSHQVRASVSHGEKGDYIESLVPGQALVTLDWAQKLTPFYAREKQVEYYAKAGIAYHISHATAKINGELVDHFSVHIFEPGEKQDGTAVFLVVESFQVELKQMGVNRVMIRSDCAGCYRNAPLIYSLFKLQQNTGMIIDGLLFSEAQQGKGPCDRGSALVKGKARDHVISSRGKIETKDQFFDSLISGKLLNGVSVHLSRISNVKKSTSKILNITSYSSFEFEEDGIRMRRHRSIGPGLLFKSKLTPCEGRLEIIRSGGHTVDCEDLFWLSKTSHQPQSSNSTTTENPSIPSSGMLPCPEENCISEYRSFHMLQRHIFNDKHNYELETKTLHDHCTEIASRSLGLAVIRSSSFGTAITSSVHNGTSSLKKGWALRKVKERNDNDKPARALIKKFFNERRNKGLKANPHEAERFMKNARGNGGSLLIAPRNRLSITQIKSLFHGLLKKEESSVSTSAKGKKTVASIKLAADSSEESSDNDEDDEEESDDEEALRSLILTHKDALFKKSKNGDSESEDISDEDEPKLKIGRFKQ